MPRGTGIAAALAAALLLVACDSPSPGEPTTPAATATAQAPEAHPATHPGTPSERQPEVQDFDCTDPIWSGSGGTDTTRGLGVPDLMAITFDGGTLQWQDGTEERGGGLHFQKVGLALRTGARFELAVPDSLRGQVKIGWSNTHRVLADALRINGCAGDAPDDEWVVYPGGFWSAEPTCVGLEFTSGGKTTTVDIPVGASCP